MIVLHYLLIDSSSLYLLYFSAKERFYVFNDSKPRRQKTFCQRHFVLCRMASAYPFYHSCTFLQYRMDPSDPLAASLPVSFCHRSSLSGLRRDACLCLPFKRRPDSFVLVSSGRPVLLSSLCHFYGDADDGTDSQTMERILRRKTNLRFHALSFRLEYVYLAVILILVQWIVKIIAALL